jgi:hypothetical protein
MDEIDKGRESGVSNGGQAVPEKCAVIVDPKHPEAGNGGIVPPVEHRFKPGVRPPCGGGKKGMIRMADRIRTKLEEKDKNGVVYADAIVQTIFDMAQSKDIAALKEILDRVDGKALQRVEAVVEARKNEELAWATDEELTVLEGIMLKCRERAAAKGIILGEDAEAPAVGLVAVAGE